MFSGNALCYVVIFSENSLHMGLRIYMLTALKTLKKRKSVANASEFATSLALLNWYI